MGSATDGREYKRVSSNGNRVYVGNFDADGLNINNNWDDNRNDNLGLAARRQSKTYIKENPKFAKDLRAAIVKRVKEKEAEDKKAS